MVFSPERPEKARFRLEWGTIGQRFWRERLGCFDFPQGQLAIARVGVLQAAEFLAETLQSFGAGFAIGHGREALEFFGEFEGELLLSESGDAAGAQGGIAFRTLVGKFTETVASFFLQQPFLKSAVTPGGEVVFGDGATAEAVEEDGLDFGQRVEPRDKFPTKRAVVEATIKFVADGGGQAGDFSGSDSHVS